MRFIDSLRYAEEERKRFAEVEQKVQEKRFDELSDDDLSLIGLLRRKEDGKVVDAESEAERIHEIEAERAFDRWLESRGERYGR